MRRSWRLKEGGAKEGRRQERGETDAMRNLDSRRSLRSYKRLHRAKPIKAPAFHTRANLTRGVRRTGQPSDGRQRPKQANETKHERPYMSIPQHQSLSVQVKSSDRLVRRHSCKTVRFVVKFGERDTQVDLGNPKSGGKKPEKPEKRLQPNETWADVAAVILMV